MLGWVGLLIVVVISSAKEYIMSWCSEGYSYDIGDNRRFVRIRYRKDDRDHFLYLPYKSRYLTQMTESRVFAVSEENEFEITQQPGIPYMVSCNDLGVREIQIRSADGIAFFTNSDIPSFDL